MPMSHKNRTEKRADSIKKRASAKVPSATCRSSRHMRASSFSRQFLTIKDKHWSPFKLQLAFWLTCDDLYYMAGCCAVHTCTHVLWNGDLLNAFEIKMGTCKLTYIPYSTLMCCCVLRKKGKAGCLIQEGSFSHLRKKEKAGCLIQEGSFSHRVTTQIVSWSSPTLEGEPITAISLTTSTKRSNPCIGV